MDTTLFTRFRRVVSSNPVKTAIVFDSEQFNYAELDKKSTLIAQILCAKGIGSGDIVPVLLDRGIDTVVAMLGILKAGAAVCNINTDYPQERIDFICRDTAAKLIINEKFLAELQHLPKSAVTENVVPNDPAVVVYTSGSTGNPKGVLLSHQALNMSLGGNLQGCGPEDVFLLIASLSFIGGVALALSPLVMGQTLHIANQTIRKDAGQIIKYIHRHGITTAFFPPQLARLILEKEDGIVRTLITGSEKVRGIYSEKTRIINSYGASETFGPMTCFELDRLYEDGAPIGKPYDGSRIYLLDDEGNPVPDGQEGEICITGQLADGYLNLPELTAQKFVPNPFSTGGADTILYKTGDLGKILEDGNLLYVQRKDWMVKVRGFRVEPGEIETAMRAYSPVSQAIVISFQNALNETALYGVFTAPAPVDTRQLEQFLRKTLPDYMIPAFIEQVESLPLNQNGKIDRKNIKPPDVARFKVDYEPPRNDTERAICEAMSKVLGVERVGALDNFTHLGGDSISAFKLLAQLPQTGLSAADILALNTPRALAEVLDIAGEGFTLQRAGLRESYPLMFAERQMATEQHIDPKSCAYNVNIALEVTGQLHVDKLEQALSALVRRHSAFRSCYPMENGEFVHKVADEIPVLLNRVDCAPDEVAGLIKKANVPYDLGNAPLFRFTLYQTSAEITVLHLNIHHIIIDGTSGSVMMNELWRLYNGEELPPIEFDFTDYAVWQSEQAEDEEGKEFFTKMFADGVPENEMPTKPKRPDVLPFADTDCECKIDAGAIDEAARKLGVTTFKLLFAATGLTLAKYCGSEDVTLGTAMSGRTLPQTSDMIGMFVNTLPVRIRVPGTMRATEYVKMVADSVAEVKKHQTYPFEKIVPLLAPDRNTSRAPVFDLNVNYLGDLRFPDVPDLTIRELPIKRQALAMDLMLEFLREGDQLRIVLSYSRELYHDEVVSNMMEQLTQTIARLVEDDGRTTLRDLSELPDKQRQQILEDFAGKRSDENLGKTVVELFRERVKQSPQNRAVVSGEKSFTYAEMDHITDRIAVAVTGRGNTVGILVHRSEMMPLCAMGVLKSGAAYVPLDPSYPAERLEFMLTDAGCSVVIADEDLKDRIPGYGGDFLWTKDIAGLPCGDVPNGPKPQDTMVLLYTSGTTGKPKGVMLSHGNLVSLCAWARHYYNITDRDNSSVYASFGFDAHMLETYPPLISGACLHVISDEMRLDLPGLRNYFEQNHVNIAFFTTQLGRQFGESMTSRGLRALSVGGESLVPLNPPKDYSFYNVYGPTECTVMITAFHVDKLYDRIPIGRALDNVALYVVDKQNRLAPVGVAGELCAAGRQVGKGYLNRPDLTAEKFAKNPFSNEPDYSVMYRTGDVVRFLPDGNIDFVGRNDFQVKIRGFRVELTEIEERIRTFPAVKDAAVIPADAPGGGKCAVAYIVGSSPIDIEELNRFIEKELPSYMVPATTMQLEAIPLNQNGKVDRRKLPAPVFSAENKENEDAVRPLNDLELQIFQLTAGILGHETFGLTTNLLRAGLTSLSCIKLAAKLDGKFGVSPAVRDIMKNPTLLGIENAVIGLLLSHKTSVIEQTAEKPSQYPLSQSQMGLYFECLKNPGSVMYNVPVCIALGKDTNVEKLQNAIGAIVDAHPALRARLFMQGDEVWQSDTNELAATTEIVTVSEAEMPEIKSAFVRPFPLFGESLFRSKIVSTEQNTYLLMDVHHIVFDGTSLDLFLRELTNAYQGNLLEKESYTCFDAAQSEKEKENSEEYHVAKVFFDDLMQNGEGATVIPYDHKKGEQSGKPETVFVTVDKESVNAGLNDLGITPSSLFLGAAVFATSRFANTKKVGIAAISSGRGAARLQNTMGMFVKTLPLVFDVDSSKSAGDYLNSVQEAMYSGMAHEVYPYTLIASEYQYHPQILFAYQGSLINKYEIDGKSVEMEGIGLDIVKFPIDLSIDEEDTTYRIAIEYDSSLFNRLTMEMFVECIAHTAKQFAAQCKHPLGKFSIASPTQMELVNSFSAIAEISSAPALHCLFEKWVIETPDATALTSCDGEFNYAQLNQRANRIAHALLDKGVVKGDRIVFILPRTSHVFSTLYGIIKSGCAFVPIDPTYPRERIEHILSDCGAKFVITDGENGFSNGLDINALLLCPKDENPNISVNPEDLCYVIYTSGSTGKPKGVMLSHRGAVNYGSPAPHNLECVESIKQSVTYLSVTTVSFDAFLTDVFIPLSNGLRVVMATEEEARNPRLLANLSERTGANCLNTSPSVIMQYLEVPEMRMALSKYRLFIIGAEKFPESLYKSLREISNGMIINSYGPTEATIDCNCKILTDADIGMISVGPLENGVKEQIMDMDGNPLPVGAVGELWIGGVGVALGYVGKPELTAERFVTWNGDRYYRSGDLAKWKENGEVVVLGRNDNQIKLRGLRIELGEIENAIASQTGVTRTVVLVRNIRGQEHLCAYFTADSKIDATELRTALGKTLPKYMVPAAYKQLEAMPVTPNGKIDTKSLPEPEFLKQSEYEPPQGPTEEKLCSIFKEVLGLEQQVSALDNFFEIGGTSLAVTRVVIAAESAGLRGANGATISYSNVFANPSPRELAKLLSQGVLTSTPPKTEDSYDYSSIHTLLEENHLDAFRRDKFRQLGNVLLTGATGFLGIHMLRELLNFTSGNVYCLVRRGKHTDAQKRLKNLLFYYFEDADKGDERLHIIEGDMMDEACLAQIKNVDTVINCAANVTHFAKDSSTFDVNTGGVNNLIAFCQTHGARLVQISTASIAGLSIDGFPSSDTVMDETMLYFGQNLENQYLHSKFLAERAILEAATKGLDAKIMRAGNLMARSKDGEFQINAKANSFLGQLRAYHAIGCFPYSSYHAVTELTPIDSMTDAVLQLSLSSESCRVFHPYNNHTLFMGDIILTMKDLGISIAMTEDEEFESALSAAMKDPTRAESLTSFIAYQNMAQGRTVFPVAVKNKYTTQALLRLGWRWSETDGEYLRKFLTGLMGLGFFGENR